MTNEEVVKIVTASIMAYHESVVIPLEKKLVKENMETMNLLKQLGEIVSYTGRE
jgi:hypothetical protein